MLRRMAGFKRRQVAAWTGKRFPRRICRSPGTLSERVRHGDRGPGHVPGSALARRPLRLRPAPGYGALPLWALGLFVDGVWCGLLRRRAVVLPLIRAARRPRRGLVAGAAAALARSRDRPARRARRGADRHPGGRRRRARRRTAPYRTGSARRYAGPAGGAVDAGGAGQAGVRHGPRAPPASSWTTRRTRRRRPSPSCGTSCAASIRRSSPTGGWSARCGRSRRAAGSTWRCARTGWTAGAAGPGGRRGGRVLRRRGGADQRRQAQRYGPGRGGTDVHARPVACRYVTRAAAAPGPASDAAGAREAAGCWGSGAGSRRSTGPWK